MTAATDDTPALRQPLVRSCLPCHQRRIKCDKGQPCAGCVRSKHDCVYPPPGKLTRRRKRKQTDTELLGRIRELESAVDKLGSITISRENAPSSKAGGEDVVGLGDGLVHSPASQPKTATLVVNEDVTQYLSNGFWVKMSEEIAELKEAMQAPDSETSEDEEPPNAPSLHQSFVFGNSLATSANLRLLRPDPRHMFAIWEAYKENVDSIIKVLHIPSAKLLMMNAISNADSMSRPAEALLFAICLGAVISMKEAQCRSLLDDDREVLIKRFRLGTEQALARASFMSNYSLTSLQAFSLYISFIRGLDESKTVWALGSLAVSLAVSVGLHRDGSQFGLKPFDTEMRRRLWWHIWSLNRIFDDDHGISSTSLLETSNDTRLPLNINDEELDPSMTQFPEEREGFTGIFPAKIRYELAIGFAQILGDKDKYIKSPKDRDAIVEQYRSTLHEKYMRHCDLRIPVQLLVHNICKLLITKLWLFFSLPGTLSAATVNSDTPAAERERVFETACEAVEIWIDVVGHPEAIKWRWFASAWMQWQLVCYIMAELPKRSLDATTVRAWKGIEDAWEVEDIRPSKTASSVLWKALGLLWRRAKAHRRALESGEHSLQDSAHNASIEQGSTSLPQRVTPLPVAMGQQATNTQGLVHGMYDLPYTVVQEAQPVRTYYSTDSGTGTGSDPSPQTAQSSDFGTSQDWNDIGNLDPRAFDWNQWVSPLGEWDNTMTAFPDQWFFGSAQEDQKDSADVVMGQPAPAAPVMPNLFDGDNNAMNPPAWFGL